LNQYCRLGRAKSFYNSIPAGADVFGSNSLFRHVPRACDPFPHHNRDKAPPVTGKRGHAARRRSRRCSTGSTKPIRSMRPGAASPAAMLRMRRLLRRLSDNPVIKFRPGRGFQFNYDYCKAAECPPRHARVAPLPWCRRRPEPRSEMPAHRSHLAARDNSRSGTMDDVLQADLIAGNASRFARDESLCAA